ncbi:MAG: protein kinase [Gloeomargarita sp. GMQP_bins_14]
MTGTPAATFLHLHLGSNGRDLWLGPMRPHALLGRHPTSDLMVDNTFASRYHAHIEYRPPDFYLRDDSRNGTFIRWGDPEQVLHVRGEEVRLPTAGEISLGCAFDRHPPDVIRFRRTAVLPPELAPAAALPEEETTVVAPMPPQPLAQVPSELQLDRVLEPLVRDLVAVLSPEGVIYYQNPALARWWGQTLPQVLGRDFLEFVHPEDRQALVNAQTQALLQSQTLATQLSLRLRVGDERWHPCSMTLRPLPPDAGLAGLLLVGQPAGQPSDTHLLGGRYRVERRLASGGFCETYLGRDQQRPGEPLCVIKRLRLDNPDPDTLATARRLFATEAATLETLGHHDQIPRLLAYLEQEEDFYLVQDFIAGHPLSQELGPQQRWDEIDVVWLLWELLAILDFVQKHKVIHRDITPDNILRRESDRKLVLIDFGSVKVLPSVLGGESRTVVVGKPGYMAPEQAWGQPNFTSDLYALGVIAIEALTGQSPQNLPHLPRTRTLDWQGQVQVSDALREILASLLHPDWQQRFPNARTALKRIEALFGPPPRRTDFL